MTRQWRLHVLFYAALLPVSSIVPMNLELTFVSISALRVPFQNREITRYPSHSDSLPSAFLFSADNLVSLRQSFLLSTQAI
jgi:hypothetical protein